LGISGLYHLVSSSEDLLLREDLSFSGAVMYNNGNTCIVSDMAMKKVIGWFEVIPHLKHMSFHRLTNKQYLYQFQEWLLYCEIIAFVCYIDY
jgi:hypothetical protein